MLKCVLCEPLFTKLTVTDMLVEAENYRDIAQQTFGAKLVGVYLYGSAISGGLRPLSDIDLIVVIDETMTPKERDRLTASLLKSSGTYPNLPGEPRCVELSVIVRSELATPKYPAKCEYLYGEWLRGDLEKGLMLERFANPGVTLTLAQAFDEALPVSGPELSDLLTPIPMEQVRLAMREALPTLVEGLRGDERNVLLTLARMWRTADQGVFVSKDEAADWAVSRVPQEIGQLLAYARAAYLGTVKDDWSTRTTEAQRASDYLQRSVLNLL